MVRDRVIPSKPGAGGRKKKQQQHFLERLPMLCRATQVKQTSRNLLDNLNVQTQRGKHK